MTPFDHDSIAILPDDPDVRDVAEYVAGVMTDEQAEAFEERLAVDDALFQRVGPFLEAWVSPKILPAEIEIRKTVERERALARRRTRTMSVGRLAAAAAVVLGVIGVGVAKFAARDRADHARAVAHAPANHDVPTGAQLNTPPQPSTTVATAQSARKPAAAHRKQVVVAKPQPGDPAAERMVATLAQAQVGDAAVTRSSMPEGAAPVSPTVPWPKFEAQIDSTTIAAQENQRISGKEEPPRSRWPTWLPRPHLPRPRWPWGKQTIGH